MSIMSVCSEGVEGGVSGSEAGGGMFQIESVLFTPITTPALLVLVLQLQITTLSNISIVSYSNCIIILSLFS